MHTRAAKFGYTPINKAHKRTICACCNLPVDKEDIDIMHDTTNIYEVEGEFKLSSGVVMFFSFIKMLIYYLILRAIITDSFNLVTNFAVGQQC